jgi:hypothetical protein
MGKSTGAAQHNGGVLLAVFWVMVLVSQTAVAVIGSYWTIFVSFLAPIILV